MGKIKTGFILKRLTPEDVFKEKNAETNMEDEAPIYQISKATFIKRMVSIKLNQINQSQITHLAHFLEIVNFSVDKPHISLRHFQHALRKLKVKDQHKTVNFYQEVTTAAKIILKNKEKFKELVTRTGGQKVQISDIRFALYQLNFSSDMVETILTRFMDAGY